jgi:SOS-response transcriptional repressor LexA
VDEQDKLRADMATAMAEHKISQATLAKMVGLTSQSAVSNILKGKREVTASEAAAIRRALGIQEGPPVREIPLIGLASAGAWQEAVLMPTRSRYIPSRLAGNRAFAVEIVGDSMDKLLPEGGWAVVDPDQTHLYAGRVYLIANEDEETTIKRYCGEPARFEPVSNNEMHEPLMLSQVRYRVVGRVVSYGNDEGL